MNAFYSMIAALLIAVTTQPVTAQSPTWKQTHEALDHQLAWEEYNVFYTGTGDDAFPERKSNVRRRTHYLDSLQRQIDRADEVYSIELGLTPPLQMPLYARGKTINLHITRQNKLMGTAGDRLVRYSYDKFGPTQRVLSITLASRWTPPNATPEHEVFHLYQYGYSFFKNQWYLEGLARSTERFFKEKSAALPEPTLPKNNAELDKAINSSVGAAANMWTRLDMLCDPSCAWSKNVLPGNPLNNPVDRTVASPKGARACGGSIILPLLKALDAEDDLAAKERGINPENWPEKEQRSAANNKHILAAMKKVVENGCPIKTSTELGKFHALLSSKASD